MHGIDVAHDAHGDEDHRDDPVHHPERDLRRDAETEHQQHQRVERDLGQRVDGGQDRLRHLSGKAVEAEREAAGDPADRGDDQRYRKRIGGRFEVPPEHRGSEQRAGIAQGDERRRERDFADRRIQRLPCGDKENKQQNQIQIARRRPGTRAKRGSLFV